MVKCTALASGSSGNCFYIEQGNDAVLIDAGMNAKNIFDKIEKSNINLKKIKGIFITHEHIDHVRGADVFARKMDIPVFATKGTIKNCNLCSDEKLINLINNDATIKIGKLKIKAFVKSHAAKEPISYSVIGDKRVSVITDLGYICDNVLSQIAKADFLFLESNHDLKMLEEGPYPYFLKKWIKGKDGHLSNMQAGLGVLEYASSRLQHVVLSHISKENNTPEKAMQTFKDLLKERSDLNVNVSVSLENAPTQIFSI